MFEVRGHFIISSSQFHLRTYFLTQSPGFPYLRAIYDPYSDGLVTVPGYRRRTAGFLPDVTYFSRNFSGRTVFRPMRSPTCHHERSDEFIARLSTSRSLKRAAMWEFSVNIHMELSRWTTYTTAKTRKKDGYWRVLDRDPVANTVVAAGPALAVAH